MKYKIESIRERRNLSEKGTTRTVYVITYRTDFGLSGRIELPKAGFNAEKAHEAIQKELLEIAALINHKEE